MEEPSINTSSTTTQTAFHNFQDIIEINDEKDECFTLRYNESNDYLAAGTSQGNLCIYDYSEPAISLKHIKNYKISEFPITCLRWKPKNKTTILLVTADGIINEVHSKSGKILQKIEEKNNPLMCCDYSNDGLLFATGGNDRIVKLYDDNTKVLIRNLESHRYNLPQHANRVFSVKFSDNDPNLLLSGGWDNTILLYDLRAKEIQSYLYGPHICGDGMDLKNYLLLTVSWAKSDQIQLFDLKMNKNVGVFQMILDKNGENNLDNVSYLYSCRFNPVNNTFCVTGSNKNYLRVYDYTNYKLKILDAKKDLDDLTSPCYCCDYNKSGNKIAYGCSEKNVRYIDI